MEFRILGTVEVVGEDGPMPVGGHRERALLARLLLSPNQVVSSPVLTDDLWSGAPTEGAAQALWVHVSRLRKTLRDHGGDDLLVTRPPGYVLQTDLEAIDAYRFETLVERARRLAASGELAAAAGTFRQALALWRGPALADVADAPFAQAEAARLDEARLTVLEARIEADLAGGLDSELIGELASLTREHPLRERLWALRMTALYRAGRQAEALRTYQELRRYLGEELGIDPSEELRALEGAILRQEAHLARPDVSPAPVETAPSSGVVTFMFTDVVGSTELLDRLGDEKADDLRRRHFAALRQSLTAHGGSEVKSLGDGLMAAFASPVAALRCAVEIQQTAAAGSDDALAIRVGVHAGEPIADEDDFFGSPVVVAQRLCGRARGGQILASTLVQGLAGNRAGCAFTTLGGLALKGFAEPVAACEIEWAAPATRNVVPLPVPVARQDSVFIRPDADMARIDEAWEAVRSGRRHVLLLAGEPGIGKTRTSAEVARVAHEAGATVLYGRCEERMGVPYQPFVEALGTYLRQAPHPELGRMAGELVRLAPELGERFPDLAPPLSADPDTERYRLFDAVAAWLAAVAAQNPTALLLDDLHWATAPTLAMLVHLACSGEPGSLLVIGTYRDTQLDVTPELADTLADLLRQPDVARVRLGGLDADGVASYLEAMARHELDAEDRELAAVLHAETNGNPFFLNQMLRHLIETGTLHRRDGKWSAGPAAHVEVPDSVRDVIARRLTRLPDETREILTLAAVQGDRFDLRVIVEATEQPQISVLRALDPAISARLVTEADGFSSSRRFVHALVRHTIYDGLPGAERLELHRATGTALAAVAGEAWPEHAGELAGHWLAAAQAGATPDEARRTLEYAEEAARRATASLAYEDAVTQLARALPLVELIADRDTKADVHIELLIALGEAQRRAGDAGHRETLLEASRLAAERGNADALARAALANTRGLLSTAVGEVDHERVAAFEAALDAVGDDDTPTRARLLAALAAEITYIGDRQRRVGLADEALAIARRTGDVATLAHVLLQRFYAISSPDTLTELLDNTEELVSLTEHFDDPVVRAQSLWLRGRILAWAGNMDEANRRFEAAERLTEELGQPTLRWLVGTTATARTILAGDVDEGERRALAGFEMGQATGQRDAASFLAGHLFLVRLEQDRLAELEELFAERVAALPPQFLLIRAYLARILSELDRPEEAAEHYGLLAAENFALPRDVTWMMCMQHCAAVAASLGDRAGARVLFDLLLPYAGQIGFNNGGALGAVSHYLAVVAATFGDFDEAERRFAEAAGTHERIGAPTWLARTRVEWARMLLTRAKPGDIEQAHDLLHQALATARDRGLPNIERRAVELLS